MTERKETLKYYFSVEGETEQWYLQWLQAQIDQSEAAAYRVKLDCPIQKDPVKRAKGLNISSRTDVWHLSDYESAEPIHARAFQETMDRMKEAQELGKQITYHFGYSNFTFDLWIILHRADCFGSFNHRSQYLAPLNKAYEENFESMDDYKREANFKRCLSKLTLSNVIEAVRRAQRIRQMNEEREYALLEYKGYHYYNENPSLAIWEIIQKILADCGLIT